MTLHLGIDIGVQGAIAIVDQSGRKRAVSLTLASKRRLARRGNPPLARHMRLTDGDALSVQGALKAETYQMDGEQISGWLKGGNERCLRGIGCETISAGTGGPLALDPQRKERIKLTPSQLEKAQSMTQACIENVLVAPSRPNLLNSTCSEYRFSCPGAP